MRTVRFTPRFWTAAVIATLLIGFGVIGPIFFGGDTTAVVGSQYEPPSDKLLLGADSLGRDVFLNLMYGTRTSLFIGLIAGGLATVIGTILGLLAGYNGGAIENAVLGVTNVVLAIPAIVILILLSVALDSRSVVVMAFVIAVTSWPWTARAVAAQASSICTREHLDVARLSGVRTISILASDVLPYVLSYVAMALVLQVASAILTEAGLSVIGLGPSDTVSLGIMLQQALAGEAMRSAAWWAFIPPTLVLTLITFSLLMLQSSLDEVFNPRLRRTSGGGPKGKAAVATTASPAGAVAGGALGAVGGGAAPPAEEAPMDASGGYRRQGVDR